MKRYNKILSLLLILSILISPFTGLLNDIAIAEGEPLIITNAVYYDKNEDGKIGEGDKLVITFDKEIKVATDFGTSGLFNGENITFSENIKVEGNKLTIELADSPNASFYETENYIKSGINVSSITDLEGNLLEMPEDGVKILVPEVDKLIITEARVVKAEGNISNTFEPGDKIVFETNRAVHGLTEMCPGNFKLYTKYQNFGPFGDVNETVKIDDSGKVITLTISEDDRDLRIFEIEKYIFFSIETVEYTPDWPGECPTEYIPAFSDVYGNALDTSETRGVRLLYKPTYTKAELRDRIKEILPETVDYSTENKYSSDWVVAGLGRLEDYKDRIPVNYLENTAEVVKKLAKKQDKGEDFEVTNFERMTMGILAAGGDPTDIGGINIIERIYNPRKSGNIDYITGQGLNAAIWGLIAVDSGYYNISDNADWSRDRFIQEILDNECHNNNHSILKGQKGGWQWGGKHTMDPDMTGMAMIALAPYNNDEHPEVKAAINRAVENLSLIQRQDGGFESWNSVNSESCVQVIMGLCANNIEPTEERFTKKGGDVVDALLRFKLEGTGFAHAPNKDGEFKVNGMANEQALYGLAQLWYWLDGNEGSIFKWGDKDAPIITTLNLEDNKIVEEEKLNFMASAKDHVNGEVKVKVILNEEEIEGTNGKFKAVLKEGENTIKVEATDKAGNKSEKSYQVIYDNSRYPIIIRRIGKNESEFEVSILNLQEESTNAIVLLKSIDESDRPYRVKYQNTEIPVEKSSVKIELNPEDYPKGISKVKVYIWDSFEGMKPLADVKESEVK